MRNPKTIAIIGIVSYILGVITSAEDLKGNFVAPSILIALSGILTVIFIIMATTYLWRKDRFVSILLVASEIALWVFNVIQMITLPNYGSVIIILLNVVKIINFLVFWYATFLLWARAKSQLVK